MRISLPKYWSFHLAGLMIFIYFVLSFCCPSVFDFRYGHLLSLAGITLLLVLPQADLLLPSAKTFELSSPHGSIKVKRPETQQTMNQLHQAFPIPEGENSDMSTTLPPTAQAWERLKDVSERLLGKISDKTGYQESTLEHHSSQELLTIALRRGTLGAEQIEALSGFYRTRDQLIEIRLSAGPETPSWVVDDAWRLQEIGEMVIQAL